MDFKKEVKQILQERKKRVHALEHTNLMTLAQRIDCLVKKKHIQNIIDLLD